MVGLFTNLITLNKYATILPKFLLTVDTQEKKWLREAID